MIPRSLYEAAAVDGATAIKQLWYITLPQLRPILLINTILITIFTLNSFDLILPLTGGGPGRATEVLSLYAYNTVFRNFDLSNGAVLAVHPAADQPRLHLLLRPAAAEGDLSDDRRPARRHRPTSAPTSPTSSSACSSPGRCSGSCRCRSAPPREIYVSDIRILPRDADARELR